MNMYEIEYFEYEGNDPTPYTIKKETFYAKTQKEAYETAYAHAERFARSIADEYSGDPYDYFDYVVHKLW